MRLLSMCEKEFRKLERHFSDEWLKGFKQSPYEELWSCHFGLGLWVRNELLKEDSALYNEFLAGGITHKDDMSSLFLSLFYISVHRKK